MSNATLLALCATIHLPNVVSPDVNRSSPYISSIYAHPSTHGIIGIVSSTITTSTRTISRWRVILTVINQTCLIHQMNTNSTRLVFTIASLRIHEPDAIGTGTRANVGREMDYIPNAGECLPICYFIRLKHVRFDDYTISLNSLKTCGSYFSG